MLVSVIIPTYNRERTIERAVDSVLAQTWQSIELIVVDDGSVDRTVDILARYGNRIVVIKQKNQGPSAARNTGIKAATGEIVAFLDSDDSWLPEKIERQVHLLQRTANQGAGCCVCNANMVYSNGKTVTSFAVAGLEASQSEGVWLNPAEILVTRFLFFNQVVTVRRDWLERSGFFRSDLRILEDYDLALRLSLLGPWAFISDPLVVWHGGEENSLSKTVSDSDSNIRAYNILVSLRDSKWGGLLPQKILTRRLGYLHKRIRARGLSASSRYPTQLLGRFLVKFLRFSKAIGDRVFPPIRMVTKDPSAGLASGLCEKGEICRGSEMP
jgi:glycosyltransferase involved in cell wall biosynthesis